jgi:hypothetical protein
VGDQSPIEAAPTGQGTLGQRVRANLADEARPPFELMQAVLFNLVLVLGGWFLLGPTTVSRFSSLVMLPAAIASWVFSDVPATNLYGSRPETARAVLDEPRELRRFILARNLTLWILVAPATALLALILARSTDSWLAGIVVAATVLCLPMGFFGLASTMAPLLPYHAIPLRERWHRRDTWRRWLMSLVSPYVLMAPASIALLAPGALIMVTMGRTDAAAALAILVVAVWTWVFRRLTVNWTLRITADRRDRLEEFLTDPARG